MKNSFLTRLSLRKIFLLFCISFSFSLFAQSQTITGTVTGDEGGPVIGASIGIKGTSKGTITDFNGNYSLETEPNSTLVISYLGYITQEIPVMGKTVVNVQLKEDTQSLEEVVVVGYGTQRKRDVTGAIASVNAKDIQSLTVANAGEALQGRAAGVQVFSSGSPGSNVTIRVRGTGTINSSDPLLVIDGVPTDLPLNAISQDDIASMEILKDASASAIYGSRGANGVVLITTKRGTAGVGTFGFKGVWGVQQVTNMPEMLNASQFATLHNEMMANNDQQSNPAFANPESLGRGTDWLGALFDNALMQNYSLYYSGSNEKSKYYVSGAVLDQQGVVLNTNYKRYTVQFNADSQVKNWLKFSNNFTLNHDVKENGSFNIRETMAALPTQLIYNEDGSFSGPEGRAIWAGDINNPIGKATINQNTTKGYNLLENITGEVTLYDGLKFKTTGGVQAMFWDSRNWAPKYPFRPNAQETSYLGQQHNKNIMLLWDNFLTYDKIFDNNNQTISVLAGTSAQNNRYDFLRASGTDFASDVTQQMDNSTDNKTNGGNADEWALMSFLARVNYSYQGKYLATLSIRRDGSSRFGPDNRWGWFPSGSLAWRMSEESFMKNTEWINDLKWRVGYGKTGNQNIGNYSFASVYRTGQYVFNGITVPTVVPQRLPNPGIKWETVEQTNIGVDFSVLKGRIAVTLDGYWKNTNDMLVPMSVPVSTGYSDIDVPSINAGKVKNKGVELTVNTQNLTGAFEWATQFNISYNENKIVSLNDSVPMFTGSIGLNQNLSINAQNRPIGVFYGFVTDGIFQTQQEVNNHALQVAGADPYNRTSPGDIRFRDLNNDGVINDDDRTYIGNPFPDLIFAMNNTFAWKGFDLSIFLQGVYGNDIYNANAIWQTGMAVAQNQKTDVLNRWTGEGTSNNMPRAVFNDPNKNTRVSDRFIEDGSYLRIKNLIFGYTLPKNVSQKMKLATARIYFSCQNLHTFTKYSGFDPEVPASGIDLNVYPVTRTISGGINIEF